MRRIARVFAVSALLCGSASACLNDRDTPTVESEFRSRYRTAPTPPEYDPDKGPSDHDLIRESIRGGAGVAMALGSVAFMRRRRRPGA